MDVSFSSFDPNPIATQSGETEVVRVRLSAGAEFTAARLVFEIRQPERVTLFDTNERGSTVRSDPFDLGFGDNDVSHEVGFELAPAEAPSTTAGLRVYVEDSGRNPISSDFDTLATVTM